MVLVFASGRRRVQLVEWFALVSSVVVFVGMFEDPVFVRVLLILPRRLYALLLGVTIEPHIQRSPWHSAHGAAGDTDRKPATAPSAL